MRKNKWLPHILLCILNLLLILEFCLSYADSHGLLSPAALTEGSFLNSVLSCFAVASFLIFLAPYGLVVLILAIADYVEARKAAPAGSRPRLRYLIAALPAFLFTLAVKFFFFCLILATILYPDQFHF